MGCCGLGGWTFRVERTGAAGRYKRESCIWSQSNSSVLVCSYDLTVTPWKSKAIQATLWLLCVGVNFILSLSAEVLLGSWVTEEGNEDNMGRYQMLMISGCLTLADSSRGIKNRNFVTWALFCLTHRPVPLQVRGWESVNSSWARKKRKGSPPTHKHTHTGWRGKGLHYHFIAILSFYTLLGQLITWFLEHFYICEFIVSLKH